MKDFINIDSPKNNVENDGLSNKLLNKSFYPILSLSVYNYLDYTDFFIFIQSKRIRKKAIVVITTIPITTGTLLIVTIETTTMLETRSNQIDPLKNAENTSNFKIQFYNDVIVIKELGDIDIIILNDKTAIPEVITLEIL